MTSEIVPIRYGSVCSGIEAMSCAVEPLGWQPTWFAEIEAFPSAVLAHHWPDVPNLGDMTLIADRILAGEIEAPDVLVGGTPCQAFSVAGLRGGLSDSRGQLTLSYVELANAIDSRRSLLGQQPCVTWWENVPGVLSSKDNAFGCFLGALAGESCELQPPGKRWADAGCVFGPERAVAWRILDAQYFGLAQRRRRVFVVASAREGFDPAAVLFESEGVRRDTPPSREAREDIAGTLDASLARGRGAGTNPGEIIGSHWDEAGNPHPTLNQSHNTGGIGASNQEIFSQRGAGIVPAIAIQNATRGKSQNGLGVAGVGDRMYTLDQASQHGVMAYNVHENQRAECTLSDTAGAVKCAGGKPGQGYPAVMTVHGTQDPDVRVDYAHTLGRNGGGENAVFTTREVAQTITQNYGKQPDNSDPSLGPNLAIHHLAVRRLTPVECERLQGFPDGHTDVPYRKKTAADGPRYKAIGNSMAVRCMRWIGGRIGVCLQNLS